VIKDAKQADNKIAKEIIEKGFLRK